MSNLRTDLSIDTDKANEEYEQKKREEEEEYGEEIKPPSPPRKGSFHQVELPQIPEIDSNHGSPVKEADQ